MFTDFDLIMAGRLLLASLLGALIGLEREIHGRTAGFRTHLLVALGSALFVIISINFYHVFGDFSGKMPVGVDPGRVAAQVVVGIGFLGAGAIIHERSSVRGLTTAACLWVAAAIGAACGAGLFWMSILVTVIALSSLVILKKIEGMIARDSYALLSIDSSDIEGQLERITQVVNKCGFQLIPVGMEKRSENGLMFNLQVKMRGNQISYEVIDRLSAIEGVTRVDFRRLSVS